MARSVETLTNLPDYAVLKGQRAPQKAKAVQLITEGHQLKKVMGEAEERLKEIKSELSQIQLMNDLPGLRFNEYCFMAVEREGRPTLDKSLLIDHGVDPAVIAASTKRGSPYVEMRFEIIGESGRRAE